MATKKFDLFEARMERRRRISRIPVRRLRDRQNPLEHYNGAEFKLRFHMYKETALFVTAIIEEELLSPLKRGCQLPAIQQVLIAARFYTTGSFQIAVGDLNSVHQSTVSKIVKRVSKALASQCRNYVKFPGYEEAVKIRQDFHEIGNFPGVTGAIDGCLIKVVSPGGENAELFRSRKGYFALNVQIVCDAALNFRNIVARWYGSAHDSRIFENSALYSDLEANVSPGLLLGDSGYPCLTFLMPPLVNPTTPAEKRFQKAQLKTRNTAERSIGVWKRKFPCLNHLRLSLNTNMAVIVATAVLHNITRSRRDIFQEDEHDENLDNQPVTHHQNSIGGNTTRATIINTHFSN